MINTRRRLGGRPFAEGKGNKGGDQTYPGRVPAASIATREGDQRQPGREPDRDQVPDQAVWRRRRERSAACVVTMRTDQAGPSDDAPIH